MLCPGQTSVLTCSHGTPANAAPELLMHSKLTPQADIYALGIISECLAGWPLALSL